MIKYKILTIIGARPQFIKSAAVSKEIHKIKNFSEIIVHTGQHYDKSMSEVFFSQLGMSTPKYHLKTGGKSHNEMIGLIILEVDKIIKKEKPSLLLVYGDTNSTLAGAIAAKKHNIPIAHVEAGVRNFDEFMPEEVNRYITDRISNLNFCVTKTGKNNLINEGFNKSNISSKLIISGDVMYDIFLETYKKVSEKIYPNFSKNIINSNFILCTIHRASNVDNPKILKEIIESLNIIHKEIKVIMLVHPRTKNIIDQNKINTNYITLNPIGYEETLFALSKCKYVITDSGGLVREAYFAQKKSLFILSKPVWPEINEENCSINVSPKTSSILLSFSKLKVLNSSFKNKIFGKGNASSVIVKEIKSFLQHNA
jgi:UDP-GlcNAc3NAcA epimerase